MGITRFPGGLGTRPADAMLSDLPFPAPARLILLFEEFVNFVPSVADMILAGSEDAFPWDATLVGGSSDIGISQIAGGAILLVASGTAGDRAALRSGSRAFTVSEGVKTWFEILVRPESTGNDQQYQCGLSDAPFAGPANGVIFQKDNGDADWVLTVHKGGMQTFKSAPFGFAVQNEPIILSFQYDGKETISWGVNFEQVGSQNGFDNTNLPGTALLATNVDIVSDVNGTFDLHCDYILAAVERFQT